MKRPPPSPPPIISAPETKAPFDEILATPDTTVDYPTTPFHFPPSPAVLATMAREQLPRDLTSSPAATEIAK